MEKIELGELKSYHNPTGEAFRKLNEFMIYLFALSPEEFKHKDTHSVYITLAFISRRYNEMQGKISEYEREV